MPELPEVETIVRDLRLKVLQRTFIDIWTDAEKLIKFPAFPKFKKEIIGLKVEGVNRRGKNIIFELSERRILLVHLKMTGHLLLGKWRKTGALWRSEVSGPMQDDPTNRFLHLIFWLDSGQMIALSDMRKFAKVELRKASEFYSSKYFKDLGPEPLSKSFSSKELGERIQKRKRKIKQILMDQSVIAGIGNIYADEILWQAKISPFRPAESLSFWEVEDLCSAMKEVLKKAVAAKGSSVSDYRTLSGEKGKFQEIRKVYRKEGERCPKCGEKIKRQKIGGRSAHFCPKCQK
ncbi:MAG: bifunctional DNA-formamidopyrimidine glycosylase/DNA-(apurinic or apyrimidinic site) lyase [Candidatus Paceibacterota bacterium]|jgi:formamidopyrimidine-DNA glycosylase|nr:bifunctional DNA-formamidopyrimidine glycosylase/DNA-(apurinic or apyrimidinic site) lyase [Candidatus Paceibacterota bacterium]MDD4874927.1 bifunctional DNA-formamidopyrimidine glycosylase/DNA-(apurinic or apyrimidinic site) lyase [Candidatus Paceibacterota bacterium]